MKHAVKGTARSVFLSSYQRVPPSRTASYASHKQTRQRGVKPSVNRAVHASASSFSLTLSPKALISVVAAVMAVLGMIMTTISINSQNSPTVLSQGSQSKDSVQSSVGQQTVSRSYTRAAVPTVKDSQSQASQLLSQSDWSVGTTNQLDTLKLSLPTAYNTFVEVRIEADARLGIYTPDGFNPNHATGDTGLAYEFSQCTWWAYTRRKQLGLPVGSHFGNGWQWAASAKALGYWVDNNPQVGDIMVFSPGQAGSSSYAGHVAIVESVSNGVVTTSECGVSYGGKTFSRQFTDIHDFQYIHF